ncbi:MULTISPECIES: hypothetical protein [unclassified Paenibacillus]|uniref:hypothetical protein n=1 Tax=unclassified Paenibacillus TaxID=185978 RepID=UPI0024054DCB|nr:MULTISPECIES: hypothetical protein [unclassified Paenibacillus]MDF9843748.1 hypothetical protein [Paenibacillus sp. PastF-2]MDF9850413.1 hypothetical protein [Paenibacillus sp. PastM-2]MDF9856884.1 hypothetical protein [Paenibacillus sp. PastF-1]MDH6482259.1 hypothetical protein [Paenibacillus sp. PastH-2]MDH6509577.1 hypothetical protein [Paenibacillus sp. PastM-3]
MNKQYKFHSSVNIRFDLGEENFVSRFLPTSSHVAPFKEILSGVLGGKKSHIITGPYGSGKSLMSTILTGLISKKYNDVVSNDLMQKFEVIDDEVEHLIREVKNHEIIYIPVILEGNVQNLRRSLISSIHKALKKDGTNIVLPSLIIEIINVVKKWETEFPLTYTKFMEKLSERNQVLSSWIKLVENFNEDEIIWFTNIYPSLTSGSNFIPGYTGELVSQLNHILKELQKIDKGLLIVHDEFGRLLQSLNTNEVHETMQDLQDIAELADHNSYQNLSILLITHKNMRQYAQRFNEELQREFQRIEKRFSIYNVESDQSTFVRISNMATQHMRKNWNSEETQKNLWSGLSRYPLFPELTQFEKTSLIVEGSYPIHPITLFCMPKLANIVAQNERTMFTFLESNENGGLKYHYEKEKDWYTVDKLFDYFEPAFDEFEHDSNIKKSYLLYKRLQKRLVPSIHLEDQLKILKLLTIWDIANLNIRVVPSLEFISFALVLSLVQAQELIDDLYKLKILRYLNDGDRFMLYEGSIVDVNVEIENKLLLSSFSIEQKLELAERLLESRFYLPKLYNDEKSITRYAEVRIAHQTDITESPFNFDESEKSDFNIVYIIVDNLDVMDQVRKQVFQISLIAEKVMFVMPTYPIDSIYNKLDKLLVIEKLEQDKVFLIQDRFLIDELAYLKKSFLHDIRMILSPFVDFSKDCEWIYKGESLEILDERSLSNSLSNIMYKLYPSTPEVRNEAFNRRVIAKVQEKGAYKVVDKILEYISANSDEINISGFGPDFLIYATVLKNNGLDPLHPELIKDESLILLREDLLTVIRKERGSFKDLINIFKNTPFAVRQPIIGILLPTLLGKEWKYTLFYNNGIFIQTINGELLWRMINNPNDYSFAYQSFEGKYGGLLDLIEGCFSSYIQEEDRGLQTPVFLSKVLVRWYQSLPRLARVTNRQSALSNQLREIIRIGEVRPLDAMDRFLEYTNMGKDKDKVNIAKTESEIYISTVHKDSMRNIIFNSLSVEKQEDLIPWAKKYPNIKRKTSKLLSSIINSNSENYIDNITDALVGVSRQDWSDATDDVFRTELLNELDSINSQEVTEDYIEVTSSESSLVLAKVNLSAKSNLIYDDIKRKLKYTGRTVKKDEILVVLWKLMQDISAEKTRSIDEVE